MDKQQSPKHTNNQARSSSFDNSSGSGSINGTLEFEAHGNNNNFSDTERVCNAESTTNSVPNHHFQSSNAAVLKSGWSSSLQNMLSLLTSFAVKGSKKHGSDRHNLTRPVAERACNSANGSPLWQEIHFNEKEADALGKYNDFETIDWVRDLRRDRERHYILKRKKHVDGGVFAWFCSKKRDRLVYYYDAASGWFCLLLVALLAASVAGFIDIAAQWLTNLTTGLCWPEFWFNREQCCWSSNETFVTFRSTNESATRCPHWQPWSELIFSKSELSGVGGSLLQYISFVVCSVAVAALAAQLVHAFAPYASGSGISEIKTILSGFVIRNYLGLSTLVIKSVTLVLVVASGLVLGKEGPLVHVACCCGNVITRLFPKFAHNEAKKREILSAAAAAGVAVAFGAPLGGVLFSLEEVSYYFPLKTLWRSFFCALFGALVLRTINPFGNARLVIFYIDYHAPWRMFELIPFVMLGVCGGVLGALFIKANYLWCRYRKESSLGRWPRTEVVVIALLTALISFHNPYTRAGLSSVIERLYQRCSPADDGADELCDYYATYHSNNHTALYTGTGQAGPGVQRALWQLSIALVVKVVLWVFTVGMKVPTGLFIPSLAIGAILGRLIGIGVEQAVYAACTGIDDSSGAMIAKCIATNTVQPGIYAMLGSAAVMAGVTRMTVTLVVMMLEVTGGLEYIVPLMVAVMVAKWTGDACEHLSIYDAHIDLNTYPYLDHKAYAEDLVLSNTLIDDDDVVASDIMTPPGRGGGLRPNLLNNNHRDNGVDLLPPTLFVVSQHGMRVGELEALCAAQNQREPHGVRGFPVVTSRSSPYVCGFVVRKELKFALDKMKLKRRAHADFDDDFDDMPVVFGGSRRSQDDAFVKSTSIQLSNIVDFAPVTVTLQTTIEIIIDLFRKLGLRHVLVTHNGKLVGIITKKDVVRFLKRRSSGARTRVLLTSDSVVESVDFGGSQRANNSGGGWPESYPTVFPSSSSSSRVNYRS